MTDSARILYATDTLSTDDIHRRVPRHQQSIAASRLLKRLEGADFVPTARSKSHSRGVVAAAAGNTQGLLLGIDIEWMAPDRPFGAIARTVFASAPQRISIADFYLGWTYFEAHYKAFQCFPSEASVHDVVAHTRDGIVLHLDDGTRVMQRCVADAFQLCVVWRDATRKIDTLVDQT